MGQDGQEDRQRLALGVADSAVAMAKARRLAPAEPLTSLGLTNPPHHLCLAPPEIIRLPDGTPAPPPPPVTAPVAAESVGMPVSHQRADSSGMASEVAPGRGPSDLSRGGGEQGGHRGLRSRSLTAVSGAPGARAGLGGLAPAPAPSRKSLLHSCGLRSRTLGSSCFVRPCLVFNHLTFRTRTERSPQQ